MALKGIGNERKKGSTSNMIFCKWLRWKNSHCEKKEHQRKKINMENIHNFFCKKRQFQNDEMKVNWNQGYLNVHVFKFIMVNQTQFHEKCPTKMRVLKPKPNICQLNVNKQRLKSFKFILNQLNLLKPHVRCFKLYALSKHGI
jgi:hypothetical protein